VKLGHACALLKVGGVLSLRQKQAVGEAGDGGAKEVVEVVEIGHGKLGVEAGRDVTK